MCCNVDVYFVMGTVNCMRPALVVLEEALEAGITMFQLREKGEGALTGDAYIEFATQCQQLCQQYGVPFIVNDDIALAELLEADGIHVGQDDTAVHAYRTRYPQRIVGISVHTLPQFSQAIEDGANYVGIGPIFETTSKRDARPPSIDFLKVARRAYRHFPIVAIGGITTQNVAYVRAAGADGVAVIRDIAQSHHIAHTVQALRQKSSIQQ